VDKLVSMAHEYYEDWNNKFKKVGWCKLDPCEKRLVAALETKMSPQLSNFLQISRCAN
jgi:hypothetical protein